MSHVIITGQLSAAVADAGTLDITYPARPSPDVGSYNEGDFHGATGHKFVIGQSVLSSPDDFSVAIDGTDITITNKSGATWADDSNWTLELQLPGKPVYRANGESGSKTVNRAARADTVLISLGAPDTLDADGICASQSVADGGSALLNGAVGATLDVPRNVVAAWTGTAVVTVTGTDEYGNTVVEASASGTSLTGKKAFKKITGVVFTGAVTLATVGTGDVLGLPVFLPGTGYVVKELQDGSAPTAGTLVAGVQTSGGSTSTTGDVRGTYDPNAACNGELVFHLVAALPDPTYLGIAQFAG